MNLSSSYIKKAVHHIYQPREGYDTRSIFKRSLTSSNSEYSFS